MIKKFIKMICIICTCICTCFTLFINVKAETATYYLLSANEVVNAFHRNYGYTQEGYCIANSEVRVVFLTNPNHNSGNLKLVSKTAFMYNTGFSSNISPTANARRITVNGESYYIGDWSVSSGTFSSADVPLIVDLSFSSDDRAVYYTFGAGSVDPIEPVNWGQLRNVNYSTKVAGTGQASLANLDTITWQTDIDTFGNEITDSCAVDVRAIRGSWSGNTLEDLLKMTGDNLVTSNTVAPVLATLPASAGTFSIEWDEVIQRLNIGQYINLLAKYFPDNEKYIKEGWIYEIRLVNEIDDYEGTWQRIYTATSATAQGSETIINSNNFDINVNQMLQEISILNNQETTTININDVDYYTQNPETGVEPEGGTNLWDILKALLEGIFQLLAKLGDIAGALVNLVSDLLTGLLDLIHDLIIPENGIPETVTQDINNNINNYFETDQPELYALQQKINTTASELRTLASGQSGDCVITWDDVTMNLGLFQAGTVVLVRGGSFDFGALFNDLLDAAGITYDTYSFIVSGVIYLLLIALINRKIINFLRKS